MSGALTLEQRVELLEAALGLVRSEPGAARVFVARRTSVLHRAATYWCCGIDELVGRRREHWLTNPRAAIVWALRQGDKAMSFPRIGRLLGDRDHSTCINLHRRALAMRDREPHFAAICDELAALAQRPEPFLERDAA